jgi:DNA helicase II / ATP-dependent DNA helicase PcrA
VPRNIAAAPTDGKRRGAGAALVFVSGNSFCTVARRFILQRQEGFAQRHSLSIDYEAALNPAQLAAATAGGGPVLIVAGAGTGKTRTLIYRVAYLVETGVPPEGILLLTFTRRASREMLGRAATLLDGRCERVRGGTFHAVCLNILRRYADRIGYPRNFTILDASDSADVIDLIRTERGLHRSEKRFPKKATLQNAISASASRDIPLAQIINENYPQFVDHTEAIDALSRAYHGYKRANGLMDYDDLLARTIELCLADVGTHRQIATGNRHVLVDEYQDTNRTQAQLVQLFCHVHGNVTAVGDDAQSIYGFRGADHRNILQFPEVFPGASVYKLEHNYRSTQPILDVANVVLRRAEAKYEKELFSDEKDGDLPALVHAPDTRWQSRFVAQVVVQFREEGVGLDRIAVLFRASHNSFDLETELDRLGIPFVKYGGRKLSEAAHVRDVIAHLRVVENPGDVVSWMRILKLIEGIGSQTAQRILDRLATADDPFAGLSPVKRSGSASGLERLATLLATVRGDLPPAEQVARVIDYYRPILERVYSEDHPRRAQDLESLAAIAEAYVTRAALLEAIALDPLDLAARSVEGAVKDEAPLVLSTIHSAKGLEFDTVFVIDALDGVIPSRYAVKSQEELDEELRLLYVALTRAERRLFVVYPMVQYQRGAGDFITRPSRFLENIPEDVLETWTLAEESGTPHELESGPERPKQLPPGRPSTDGLPF